MTLFYTILTMMALAVALIWLLAILQSSKKCPDCNRNLQEEGECPKCGKGSP